MEIMTIGLDLAKSVFQVHAIDGDGDVVVRKAARELTKLGHEVRLMPPAKQNGTSSAQTIKASGS